jgi:hypothetical protein
VQHAERLRSSLVARTWKDTDNGSPPDVVEWHQECRVFAQSAKYASWKAH